MQIVVGACAASGERRVPRRLYRFHCLGGGDVVFDLTGRWLTSAREIRRRADQVALALMAGADTDWTVWAVDVRDPGGKQVLLRPFTDVRED